MNNKLLSLAVATAIAAPGMASAEAILYGKLNVSLDWATVDNVIAPEYGFLRGDDGEIIIDDQGNPIVAKLVNGVDFDGWGMSANGYIPGEKRANRIGVKGSEDLGNGLKAIYQVELGINLDDTNNNVLSNADAITYRNTFVGLAGDWGTTLIGRHDTPMKLSTSKLDLFVDTMADYNGTVGFRDLRADNVVAYISPSLGGFQLSGAIVPAGGATGGGAGLNLNENSIAGAYSLAGIFSNGPFYASLAYESLGNEHFNSTDVSVFDSICPIEGEVDEQGGRSVECLYQSSDATAWRVGLGLLDWNGFSLTGIYENRTSEPDSDKYIGYVDPNNFTNSGVLPDAAQDVQLWQVQAGYAFGNSMVKAMYGQAEYDTGNFYLGPNATDELGGTATFNVFNDYYNRKINTWAIGFDHNLSKRTKLYAVYTDVENDASQSPAFLQSNSTKQWNGFSLGMMHSF
jgi:predicted porin